MIDSSDSNAFLPSALVILTLLLIGTTQRVSGPVSNLGTCVMNLGNHLQLCVVPYSPPSPDPVPLCPEVSIRLEAGNVGIPNKGLRH